MSFLPISLNVTGKKILLIGGGRIASHKIGFIQPYADTMMVIATEVLPVIKEKGIPYIEKDYEKSDLDGAFLVYTCTNIESLNRQVKADAESLGILCNVVDNPKLCDFVSPAIYKRNHITVAVGSNGQDVHRAIAVRNKIKEFLDHDSAIFDQPLQ
jgi:precorrin-2 dehydrogenase / sirohydrochlorin ferrochelatase